MCICYRQIELVMCCINIRPRLQTHYSRESLIRAAYSLRTKELIARMGRTHELRS